MSIVEDIAELIVSTNSLTEVVDGKVEEIDGRVKDAEQKFTDFTSGDFNDRVATALLGAKQIIVASKIIRHNDVSGDERVSTSISGTKYISLAGDTTLVVDNPPVEELDYVIEIVMYINPSAHGVGFSSNIDWGDAGLPDFRANKISVLTLTTMGNTTKWLGMQGNSGWSL